MAGNMNEENHESKALINKLIFLILFHQTVSEILQFFFMHIIFMYKVGKYPKRSGSESLLLIRGISWSRSRLPEILKFQNFEISETS